MDDKTKTIISGLLGAAIAAGGTITIDQSQLQAAQAQVDKATADKQIVLEQYVYDQARLGEIPTLDLSIVSTDEMSQAYVSVAQNVNAPTDDPNLFIDLQNQAQKDGVACKVQ